MPQYPLYIGCTAARHKLLGVHAVVNARGGELWRNELTLDEIEQRRDGQRIKDRSQHRIRFYQVHSRFFRRHIDKIQHLISNYREV